MEAVHLHLISNHVPIIGAFFGFVVLLYAFAKKSNPTIWASYIVFLISAAVGLLAYFSGEGAEEAAEDLPGVSHDIIEAHEGVALFTLIAFVLLAILCVIGLVRRHGEFQKDRKLASVVLALSAITFAIAAYTGYLGGQIRHTELRDAESKEAVIGDGGKKR